MSDHPVHSHKGAVSSDQHYVRGCFTTRMGFLLAAAGSAIGLGNIWRFPYIIGENGGAAFLLVYVACVAFVGVPVLLAEFVIGRHGQSSPVGSYRAANPHKPWWLNGALGVIAGFMIMCFYSVVAGWVLRYFFVGLTDGFASYTAENAGAIFEARIGGTWAPVGYHLLVMFITGAILYFGVAKGIERAAKFLMPLLLLLLLIVVVRALTLDGEFRGVKFLFTPDFTQLKPESVLSALGLSFFSLSIGMGSMLTYASYLKKNVHLGRMAVEVAALDTSIAILAGLAIFPALFALGMDPAAGTGLVFKVLPQVFAAMPFGQLVGCAFFLLLFIAALTSAISIIEPIVTIFVDDVGVLRHRAVLLVAAVVFLAGVPVSLSLGGSDLFTNISIPYLGGPVGLFGFLENTVDWFLLPLGGLIACLFLAFGWNRQKALQEVACEGQPVTKVVILWYRVVTTVAPIAIVVLMATTIYSKLNPKPEETAPEPAPAVMIEDAAEQLEDAIDSLPEVDVVIEEPTVEE